ncbi:hematopoietic progenitor cell antigen CD34 [Scomber japonicus]|uniref:hematopoietic progenitor cell antigen CD34 n=1 Tax=Scomber japonicus TaxID=13676 RepID=UPI002304D700|nr:hematopoietic progenitor cell antigen CD34 [Scomber japonicus]
MDGGFNYLYMCKVWCPFSSFLHLTLSPQPIVKCVGKEDIQESNAVKAVLDTTNCEDTKTIIEANPAVWCHTENCNVEIFQDGNNALVGSSDAQLSTLSAALQSEHLKSKLGVKKTDIPSSSGSSVFVGILVTGLLAAIAITVGYFKCQRRGDTTKGVRLAEEAYPVDQENQGNTLVSVAPLNPPPETQEKPSVNGESPEAAKTEPPPTNGHSTTKTADTEL